MSNENNKEMIIPTFTPPGEGSNTKSCYHHPNRIATGTCSVCGKDICEDCCESYKLTSGEYAGKNICYDCSQKLIRENISLLESNLNFISKKSRNQKIAMLVTFIIGFLTPVIAMEGAPISAKIAMGLPIGVVIGLLCGAGYNALSEFAIYYAKFIGALISCIIGGDIIYGLILLVTSIFRVTIALFKAYYHTISDYFYYRKYIRQTQGFIEQDTKALEQLRDYMEYTVAMEANNANISDLAKDSSLEGNTFVNMAVNDGVEMTTESINDLMAMINSHGETIREFNERQDERKVEFKKAA